MLRPLSAMSRQKGPQIAVGDSHDTSKPVRHQIAGFDPTADRAGGDVEVLRQVGNGQELDAIACAGTYAVFVLTHRSPPYSEVERTGSPIFNSAKVSRSGDA
jgi:hypothetical protein